MPTNLSIDFGSTYTSLAYYDDVNDTERGIPSPSGSVYIPSMACLNELGELLFGEEARNEMLADPTLKPFRAFKMLLHEQNQQTLHSHGYKERTPQEVSAGFLKKYISFAAEGRGVEQFDNTVICVPEHWTNSCSSMSGRAILMEICKALVCEDLPPQDDGKRPPMLKNIKVVTEPVAASAYYAHNYYRKYKKPFEGHIIVVDYGGGTLDITLTEVTAKDSGNSSNAMEIDALWRTGSGENSPDRIGDAGLAYMEKVASLALTRAGFPKAEIDGNFLRVKDKLESALMQNTKALSRRILKRYEMALEDMANDHEEFTCALYNGKKIPITYAMLYEIFAKYILPILRENLQELAARLAQEGIDPLKDMEKIKFAVVGGFGQFPLVQKAIWDFFGYSSTDQDITAVTRENAQSANKTGSADDKRIAISFGAALIAGNAVSVKVSSKYSIGLRITREGRDTYDYAIHSGQVVDPSEIYPLGGKWEPIGYGDSSDPEEMPWVFAINNIEDADFAYRMVPRQEISRKLQRELAKGAYFFGFSMDESELYTLHIFPQDPKTSERIISKDYLQPLGNFNDIFGANVVFSSDEKNILHPYR